ncbi:hypothetical protein F5Y15DRAFT_51986 [Xylariaceae sp. FL0016]|nr:hypothetical protein F5Y15DRAFT_51986 [Xylariaceae sp. FL0016]
MIWITAAVASLLATTAYAAPGGLSGHGVVLTSERSDLQVLRLSDAEDVAALAKRQSTNSTFDLAAWNTDTMAACMSALSVLSAATNPTGTAVCYNLPQLDTVAGTFMADMRLFQVSTPSGDFANIAPQDISGSVQYSGATASLISQTINRRDIQAGVISRQTTSPTLLQTYMFKGQINQDQMNQPMTLGVLEPLVMPAVTLSAKTAAGQTISTNVSSNEAAFVNGIFSNEVIMSDFSLATLAVQNVTNQLAAGNIAFVVPGVNILIFPVGLVVTSVWTVLGVSAYGFGTYQRYGYRDSYRRRKAVSTKGAYARI